MNPTSMDWHPSLPLLAIGWDSGAVTLCNIKSQRAKDEANYHQTTVKELMFNKSGDRMVSVDDYGNIAMWKELNCICAYDKECDVTSISTASFTIKRKNKNPKTVNLFFIGGRDGEYCQNIYLYEYGLIIGFRHNLTLFLSFFDRVQFLENSIEIL